MRGKAAGIFDPNAVKAAMASTGLSQVKFARLLGVSQATVSCWATMKQGMDRRNYALVRRFAAAEIDRTVVDFLLKEGRELDALAMCLGAPAPVPGAVEA